ncbi:MAG: hypothetical protein KAJ19_29955 [Gammaproteobacteria bacterium]|nr:hypothetical protein [Gammaproteobacteria bacterium]
MKYEMKEVSSTFNKETQQYEVDWPDEELGWTLAGTRHVEAWHGTSTHGGSGPAYNVFILLRPLDG